MAKSLVLDHVRVLTGNFRNFRGEVDKNYNRDGARFFSVAIDREQAEELIREGWDIYIPENPEYDPTLKVTISRDNGPLPHGVVIKWVDPETDTVTRVSDTDLLADMDDMGFRYADLSISGYEWDVNGNSGTKAYLRRGYFVLYTEEDPFAERYGGR